MSEQELNEKFPSIADSYECVTEDAGERMAEVNAYAQTVLAEVRTILAKRNHNMEACYV